MSKNNSVSKLVYVSLFLLFVSACTQPTPARVDMKGGQSFTRGTQEYYSPNQVRSSYNNNSYSNYTPVPQATEQSAKVESIGISDLAPPTADDKPQAKSNNLFAPVEKKPEEKKIDSKTKTVNPWTNKPRSENKEQIIEIDENGVASASGKQKSVVEEKIQEDKSKKIIIAATDSADKGILDGDVIEKEATVTETKAVSSSGSGMKWPVASKKIISSFGDKGAGKSNDGIKIAASAGDPVWASADGEVVYVNDDMKDFGNMVLIKHKDNKTTSYAHLGKVEVNKYDRVKKGDVIGYVGKDDNQASQLFFSVHKGKSAENPKKYFKSELEGF